MSVVNRRNAAFGWAAWKIVKRTMKKKAGDAVPSVDPDSKRPNKSAIALALLIASAVGVGVFWRSRSGDDDTASD